MEVLRAAEFVYIKMAEYHTWILKIGYWTLDIDFFQCLSRR